MKTRLILPVAALALIMTACGKPAVPSTVAYRVPATECIGSDPSGSCRLRVWGEGKDAGAARENARKKAVEAVLFEHITAGTSHGAAWPVVDNPAVRRTRGDYFSKFFKDGGKYRKYIQDEQAHDDKRYHGNGRVVQQVELTVDRGSLARQMAKDKITQSN